MALIDCAECGKQISSKATACPGCGAPVVSEGPSAYTSPAGSESEDPPRTRDLRSWVLYWGILAIAIVALGLRIATLPSSPARPPTPEEIKRQQDERERVQAERAIEYCDERYKEMNADRQYTPDELRFHSMTCQYMRNQYRERWGRDP